MKTLIQQICSSEQKCRDALGGDFITTEGVLCRYINIALEYEICFRLGAFFLEWREFTQ